MIPDIGIANGIMSVILNFAKAMPENIKFDIVYFHETEQTRQHDIEALGGRVFKIGKPPQSKDIKDLFEQHHGEWSALHIHAPHFAVFIAPAAKNAGIKKICVHCHSSEYSLKGNGRRNQLLSLYAKYCLKDKFACSDLAGKFWYGNRPFTVINNAIECQRFAYDIDIRNQVRSERQLDGKLVIGHIGRTDIPQKNHGFLLDVFNEIVKKRSDVVLLMMGGTDTDELKNKVKEYGIEDKALFLGMCSNVPDLLQACDVFLFPSTREGLPVSVIEAQAAGLPVLMSDSVSHEAAVTDLVHLKSLSGSAENWAEECINISSTERRNTLTEMQRSGWDLSSVTELLVKYYCGDK